MISPASNGGVRLVLLIATLALGLFGIARTLWLDEAWVANSVRAATLRDMFYYSGWLQTSPPLFLLMERSAVWLLGLSNAAFRVVPLAMELAAVVLFFVAACRAISLPLAALAAALLVSHPVVIEYSHSAKQYSGEVAACAALLAAATAYFKNPSRRSFGWLFVAAAVAPALAYSSVFLIPGLVCAVALSGQWRRALWLALAAGAMLAILYPLFIAPNYSPALREFWDGDSQRTWPPFAATLVALVSLGIWKRSSLILMCSSPILLLAASAALGWYPAEPRTALFALPCVLLLLGMLVEEAVRRWPRLRITPLIWIAAGALPLIAGWRQVRDHRNLAEEDLDGTVTYLQQHASRSDLLLVHPSVKESFELYATMNRYSGPQPVYGATGWPCCVRGHLGPPRDSSRESVIADLARNIPKSFTGRVWLVYSSRPTQWDYVGLDEGNLWRSQVWAMGCPPEEFVALANVALSPMRCSPAR
jgi:hypothetical protein